MLLPVCFCVVYVCVCVCAMLLSCLPHVSRLRLIVFCLLLCLPFLCCACLPSACVLAYRSYSFLKRNRKFAGALFDRVSANSGGDNQVQGIKSWIEGIFTPCPAQG